MKKWEYCSSIIKVMNKVGLANELNLLGDKGWEVITCVELNHYIHNDNNFTYQYEVLLKREKNETKE